MVFSKGCKSSSVGVSWFSKIASQERRSSRCDQRPASSDRVDWNSPQKSDSRTHWCTRHLSKRHRKFYQMTRHFPSVKICFRHVRSGRIVQWRANTRHAGVCECEPYLRFAAALTAFSFLSFGFGKKIVEQSPLWRPLPIKISCRAASIWENRPQKALPARPSHCRAPCCFDRVLQSSAPILSTDLSGSD